MICGVTRQPRKCGSAGKNCGGVDLLAPAVVEDDDEADKGERPDSEPLLLRSVSVRT